MSSVTQRAVNKLSMRLTGGEHAVIRFTVTAVTGGAAVDLTGAEIFLRVKSAITDADDDALLNLETGDGIEVVTPASGGLVDVTFTSAQTTALEALIEATAETRSFVYDLWVIDAVDRPQPVVDKSTLTVARGVYSPP